MKMSGTGTTVESIAASENRFQVYDVSDLVKLPRRRRSFSHGVESRLKVAAEITFFRVICAICLICVICG